nr:heparan-alpha-glucosaminide N-acetyltransferase domain-containing protein [uncultured Arsenicibacter sp.]
MKRIPSIDFARGLVMVIMALDHVRELMHVTSQTQSPTDLSTTTGALFMTRWITHLCAPTFVFLSGTSAYLSLKNSGDVSANQRFLRSRGLWLLFLEITVVNFALWFDLSFRTIIFQVIAAIGAGFLMLSFLLKAPARTVGLLGLFIILCHNLVQGVTFTDTIPLRVIWSLFFRPDVFPVTPQFMVGLLYPWVPWLGIMLAGYGAGLLFELPDNRRRRTLLLVGLGSLAVFVLVRLFNSYGDPAPWSAQKTPDFTFLSFINTTKYPPSLLYTTMTLGVTITVMALVDGIQNRFTEVLSVYGRVPMFYYLIHWYLIHTLMLVMLFMQGFTPDQFVFGPFQFGRPKEPSGVDLPTTYLIWLGIVVLLYFPCRWYWQYKRRHKEIWWLRYI